MADRSDPRFRGTLPLGRAGDSPGAAADPALAQTFHGPPAADPGLAGTIEVSFTSSATPGESRHTASIPSTQARAYADGVITTVSREVVSPDSEEAGLAVRLPYKSSDVIHRIGSYDVLAELGRGGMGVVYRAYALRLCRPCALKVIIAGVHASQAELIRFQNEAMLAARMQHPHIVSVFDAGEEDGLFYFVMELVEGRPLFDLIEEGSEDNLRIGLRAIAESARALHYAHEKGVIHRDIKPDNILIDAAGHPHITDFGIAKNVEAEVGMTAQGSPMGTPLYMSPEQANGELAAIGPRSDVYSLGATLYELCTGQPPFTGDSAMEILAQVLRDEPPSPREVARRVRKRELPLDLETICLEAMQKDAARRYPSALALAEDIEAYLDDRPIAARPISASERMQKLIRRNRAVFLGAAVVFATLLIVGASFGAVMVSTIQRTSDSLRAQDERAAIDMAGTLERSIRVNMLQGRADVVRELVSKLREDPAISYVDVVRTDRTYAYTDLATRKQVARRLDDPEVIARIGAEHPDLLPKIDEVRSTAFGNIDASRQVSRGLFDYERTAWNEMVENVETVVHTERIAGEPMLTVLKPMENSEKCQACHGEEDEPGYGSNKVRAVLVVKRSQKAVEARIAANKRDTLLVGLSTAGAILLLIWIFGRLFGVRLRRHRFAA